MQKYLMAIDAGTGSVRAVIFDAGGRQMSVAQSEWTHRENPAIPGSMEFEVDENFEMIIQCVRKAIEESGISGADIAALSTTSMREGIVLYDGSGRELWACANVDSRAAQEVVALKALSPDLEEQLYALSGQTFALGALPRILWVKNHLPEVYNQIAAVTMLNDWILYRITGEISVEPSNGCTSGIFSMGSRRWNPEIAATCGLRDDIFPTVHESGTAVGHVSPAFAEATGLTVQCLAVIGGGDAQLGCIGVGAVKAGQAALFGGSFWQLELNTLSPSPDPDCRVRINCHAVPDLWQYELIAFFPGLVMRWFRDAFCQLEKFVEAQTGIDAYALLEKEAADVPPGCHGMFCTFSDTMNYIAWKHAAPSFSNFSIDPLKHNKATFYRAIMENAALVTLSHVKMAEALTGSFPKEIVFASGASKSPLWCSIVADVLGVRVMVPRVTEATALGTAICAGVGAGLYTSIAEAAETLTVIEKTYEPNLANHRVYGELYEKWRQYYTVQSDAADKGVTTHMWKAPGL